VSFVLLLHYFKTFVFKFSAVNHLSINDKYKPPPDVPVKFQSKG